MMTESKDKTDIPQVVHCSKQAEQSVIGGLMMDNSLLSVVSKLITSDCFYYGQHKIIFEAMGKLNQQDSPFDLITLSEQLKKDRNLDRVGGIPYLNLVWENTPTSVNCPDYAKIVKDKYDKRLAILRLYEAIELINDGNSLDVALSKIDAVKKTEKKQLLIDKDDGYQKINLVHYLEKHHILRQLSESVSYATYIPASTVMMIGLSIFSSMSCRKWRVMRSCNRRSIPTGLYVVAEQPSGVGKTWCMSIFERPFKLAHRETAKESNNPVPVLFATNATPEALENSLEQTKGFFSAVSSEQGLFNSLLGKSYGSKDKANNNDVVLNGFDGEYISSMRIMRKGYSGFCAGGISLFAQDGSVNTILEASNGTGLSERFLMVCEPHSLGTRDRMNQRSVNHELVDNYEAMCRVFASEIISNPTDFDELNQLTISKDGWRMISQYLQTIEPLLADGGLFSSGTLRGAAGKADIQIIKIAANLHLLDMGMYQPEIEIKHIEAAINIFNELMESHHSLLNNKGIQGAKAEYTAILAMFRDQNAKLTERQIIESRKGVKPFKGMSGASDAIKSTLLSMIRDGLLILDTDAKTTTKRLYSLGQ